MKTFFSTLKIFLLTVSLGLTPLSLFAERRECSNPALCKHMQDCLHEFFNKANELVSVPGFPAKTLKSEARGSFIKSLTNHFKSDGHTDCLTDHIDYLIAFIQENSALILTHFFVPFIGSIDTKNLSIEKVKQWHSCTIHMIFSHPKALHLDEFLPPNIRSFEEKMHVIIDTQSKMLKDFSKHLEERDYILWLNTYLRYYKELKNYSSCIENDSVKAVYKGYFKDRFRVLGEALRTETLDAIKSTLGAEPTETLRRELMSFYNES